MNKKMKRFSTALSLFALVTLASCSTDEIKYPDDYDQPVFNEDNISDDDLAEDTKRYYYNDLTTSDSIYERTVKDVLLKIAETGYNTSGDADDGKAVYTLADDFSTRYTSVADSTGSFASADGESNLLARSQDSFLSTAKGGTYDEDNLFHEYKYAKYLYENYYYLDNTAIDAAFKDNDNGLLVTPDLTYSDVYTTTAVESQYETYMAKELYEDMKINYLTAEYIYKKSYASIGNSNARKVMVVAITDREDEPGDAKTLLDAYIDDYVKGTGDYPKLLGTDPDFSVLSRLWKGITTEAANTLSAHGAERYGTMVLSDDEEAWLKHYGIITDTESHTLIGEILDDKEKLDDGDASRLKVDSDLESTYTGTYTYDVATGLEKAVDDIAQKDLTTKGLYLKSSGISALPSTLTDRLFSPKVTTSKSDVDTMKANPGTAVDYTVYEPDGYRYLTVADTLNNDESDNILYYDSSSKTYYLTRVLDVVDTAGLSLTATDSIYDTAEKKEQIAREVAYAMSTTGSYKSDAGVYWLSRVDFTYSDSDFLEYMKSNYKDVFKTENPYSSEAKYTFTD